MIGMQACVCERRHHYAVILIALTKELQSRLEARWLEVNENNYWQEKRKAAENGAFLYGLIAVACVDLKHRRYCYKIYHKI